MNIVFVNTKTEAETYLAQGFCPVECSFGDGSIVDDLEMDHHGDLSHLEGVALRAYRDHFGARANDPRFVVTGTADADACFCIAALAGLLPHPARSGEQVPPPVLKAITQDLSELAELVNRVDVNPIGVDLSAVEGGDLLLYWNQNASRNPDALSFYGGVDRWRAITTKPPGSLVAAAKTEEEKRVNVAREATITRISDKVAVVESAAWGFDVWYREIAPIIVAYVENGQKATAGVVSSETAEALLGEGGLKNVFPQLQGWGGRETIGGSPRGEKLSREQAIEAANIIAAAVR